MVPKAKRLARRPKEVEDLTGLLSMLEVIEIFLKNPEGATKVRFLQEQPQLQEENIVIAKICVRV